MARAAAVPNTVARPTALAAPVELGMMLPEAARPPRQSLREEEAREISDRVMAEHFDRSYGIFSGPPEHVAELKFSPEMSRWVSEERWHPDQEGEFDDGGSWRLKVPFSGARELIMDIMRYGAEVEVLAPAFLREAVAKEATSAADIYR